MIKYSSGKIQKSYKVVIKKEYKHSLSKVWDAISKSEHVSKWMEYDVNIELKVGGRFDIDFQKEGKQNGVITKLEPKKSLYYSWNDSMVMWELIEGPGHTNVTFTHNGLSKEDSVELGSGWEAFIDYLEPFLNEAPFPPCRHDVLLKEYEQMI